ncbi:hypothetical protein OBV_21730 [Oscillibacter valericigenes Sjm18-20]|nr:hypothetical protein OBV_21730 [Oscillibacter valericigenes Sjm18-20]
MQNYSKLKKVSGLLQKMKVSLDFFASAEGALRILRGQYVYEYIASSQIFQSKV